MPLILFARRKEEMLRTYLRLSIKKYPKKQHYSLMGVYCGKLYANLKMLAGLHLEHPPSVSHSHCVFGNREQVWIQKVTDLNIKTPLRKKKVMGNEPKGLFLSITRHLWASYFTSDSCSRAKQSPTQDCSCAVSSPVWLCTAFLLPATLPPHHCCKSQCLPTSVPLLKEQTTLCFEWVQ